MVCMGDLVSQKYWQACPAPDDRASSFGDRLLRDRAKNSLARRDDFWQARDAGLRC